MSSECSTMQTVLRTQYYILIPCVILATDYLFMLQKRKAATIVAPPSKHRKFTKGEISDKHSAEQVGEDQVFTFLVI